VQELVDFGCDVMMVEDVASLLTYHTPSEIPSPPSASYALRKSNKSLVHTNLFSPRVQIQVLALSIPVPLCGTAILGCTWKQHKKSSTQH
jgi:hypothetical protein